MIAVGSAPAAGFVLILRYSRGESGSRAVQAPLSFLPVCQRCASAYASISFSQRAPCAVELSAFRNYYAQRAVEREREREREGEKRERA